MRERLFPKRSGFTLIELLVVVAIIALLISILLPSLSRARASAKAVKCAANLASVGKSVHTYLAESKSKFPRSYDYLDSDGNIVYTPSGGEGGYQHWSYALWTSGEVGDDAFTCPEFENLGHPRTNPGKLHGDWETEQKNQNGAGPPATLQDRQAPRMAYTPSAAIMPRNKAQLGMVPEGQARLNRFVVENEIAQPGDVILATEFNKSWIAAAEGSPGNYVSKSHRPVNPFYHSSDGYNEYGSLQQGFRYGPFGDDTYGLAPLEVIENGVVNLIGGSRGTELNAVGRHHPGGDKWGGTANFLFVDGHVARTTVFRTMEDRKWGEKYYSLTGDTVVVDRYGRIP